MRNETTSSTNQLNVQNIPNHIAIIMDGNGRWAKNQNLPRSAGHKEGMNTVKEITKSASKHGVKVLTLYAFSTENWKRPLDEVRYLMQLPIDFFHTFMPEIQENNIRIMVSGFSEKIPGPTKRAINRSVQETKNNTGLILNFAMNYGGRAEIINATKIIAEKVKNNELKVSQITDETFEAHLLTQHLQEYQDVDFLIRTSGEERLSNFLLWQNAYSEFYFTSKLWPEFTTAAFEEALLVYQERNRRFGKIDTPKQ